MTARRDCVELTFKPSQRQWDEFLGDMAKNSRSAWVREAIESYIAATPTITAVPLHEPAYEPIRYQPIQFSVTTEAAAWLDRIPTQMRSYLIRYILNWYRAKTLAANDPQPRFNLDAAPLEPTGT
jgi:hypothetical protein